VTKSVPKVKKSDKKGGPKVTKNVQKGQKMVQKVKKGQKRVKKHPILEF